MSAHPSPWGQGRNERTEMTGHEDLLHEQEASPHTAHASPTTSGTSHPPARTNDAQANADADRQHTIDGRADAKQTPPHDNPHAGHDMHAGHAEAMFRRPFWISLLLTIPVLIYADLIQQVLGYTAPVIPGSGWLNPLLGSAIYWYGGWVFLRGAYDELRAR